MPVSPDFLDYVLEQLEPLGQVTQRRMFGGAGLWRHGLFFGLIADDVLYLKADAATREAFAAAGGEPFRPFGGTTILSYWSIPPSALEDPDELSDWARRALEAAARAPAKAARRRRRPAEPA